VMRGRWDQFNRFPVSDRPEHQLTTFFKPREYFGHIRGLVMISPPLSEIVSFPRSPRNPRRRAKGLAKL